MPIYIDEEGTAETNPNTIDLAVFSDTTCFENALNATVFKLRPIHIDFCDFVRLFYRKQRLQRYTCVRMCFLDSLLDKLKPKLARLLQKRYVGSCCQSIELNREIFGLSLDDRIVRNTSLSHNVFMRMFDTTNDTFVRTTVHLGILSISTNITIEFTFKVRNIPCLEQFDADDLFVYPF